MKGIPEPTTEEMCEQEDRQRAVPAPICAPGYMSLGVRNFVFVGGYPGGLLAAQMFGMLVGISRRND